MRSPRAPAAPPQPDFRALFQSAPGLYLVLDPQLVIVAVSDAYLRATMTERAGIVGRGIFEVFPDNPDEVAATGVTNLRGSLQRVLAQRQPDAMAMQKYDIRRPDAEGGQFEERFWSPVNSPVLGEDGQVRYIIHRVEDVTDYLRLKRAEAVRGQATAAPALEAMEVELYRRAQELQQTNGQLRELQASLESRVAERTAELAEANGRLQHTVEAMQATEEELRSSVEELEAAEEELRQQHEELSRAHEAVRLSEGRMQAAVRHLPLVLFSHDLELRYTMMLRPPQGLQLEQVLGRTDLEILPPDTASRVTALKRQVLQTGEGLRVELQVELGGVPATYDVTLEPLRDTAGRVVGLTGAAFDISERARMEERLRRSEESLRGALDRLRALVEASPQAIIGIDLEGRVQSWLGGAERMFGWSATEVLGRPMPHIPRELEAEHNELLQRVQQRDAVNDHQTVRRRKDGSIVPVSLSKAPLHDAAGAVIGLVGVYTDITERQRAEDEGRARQHAESANRAKSQFLANMSHELRTPLNAIIGFSELLEDQTAGSLTERQQRYIGNILSSGRHLLELVNDILDLAKIEAGRLTLDPTTFDPATAIGEVRRIVEPLAVAKQLRLEVEAPEGLPLLTADRAKFKQILYNLLSNAIKFTPEGGRIWVRTGVGPPAEVGGEESLVVTVQDTGIGISPLDHARVFLEFEQIDTSYGRQQTGTGLGLTLTRRLVELHHGRIQLHSEVGEGATFTVTLPRRPPAVPVAEGRSGRALERPLNGDRPVVLVVEDDPVAAELLSHYLTSHGYAVACARTAAAALEAAQELRPVAITLDILLPDQDGLEVLAQLRALAATRGIPVVVVSITDDRELGFSLGASEWLVKPVNRERFLQAVTRAIPRGLAAGRTVLVIDDHRETVDLLADTLEQRGFRVLKAYSGEDGIQLAGERLPDAVVLDLIMPGLSGFDVARRLQEQEATRDIPVLVFTFKELSDPERHDLLGRVEGIISKSETAHLLDVIERLPLRPSGPVPAPEPGPRP